MRRWEILVVVVVIIIFLLVLFRGRLFPDNTPELEISAPTPTSQDVSSRFDSLVPENANRTQLRGVLGESTSGVVAEVEGALTILADLPDPEPGSTYQAWIQKGQEGEDGFELVSLGTLRIAKGGWVLDVTRATSGFDKYMVTLEETVDDTPEVVVLEGLISTD